METAMSKREKKEFHFFTIMDYEKEQTYLQEMHKKGWRFTGVTGIGFYHFDKCEPEDVVYQLDYNQEGLSHKEEYIQMFRDCGWEYLTDFFGYSYFRKPATEMKEDEGIFCDDASRLDLMKRVFQGRLVPLLPVLFCIIIPQLFFLSSYGLRTSSSFIPAVFVFYILLLVVYLAIFAWWGVQYWKFRKNRKK